MGASFRIIALTPTGLLDPSVAIAASRAGELGVLSLDEAGDPGRAAEAIGQMGRLSRGDCGIRLGRGTLASFDALISRLPDAVKTVIVTAGEPELERHVRLLAERGITVLLEVTSIDEARQGAAAGAHGLLAKGHEAGGCQAKTRMVPRFSPEPRSEVFNFDFFVDSRVSSMVFHRPLP